MHIVNYNFIFIEIVIALSWPYLSFVRVIIIGRPSHFQQEYQNKNQRRIYRSMSDSMGDFVAKYYKCEVALSRALIRARINSDVVVRKREHQTRYYALNCSFAHENFVFHDYVFFFQAVRQILPIITNLINIQIFFLFITSVCFRTIQEKVCFNIACDIFER